MVTSLIKKLVSISGPETAIVIYREKERERERELCTIQADLSL